MSTQSPAGGDQVPLRRPRDGRRARGRSSGGRGGSGPIPVGGSSPERSTTTIPLRGTAAAKAASLPSARSGGTPASGLTGPIRQLLGPMTGSLRLGGLGGNRDSATGEQRLRVDWPQCKAHGLCAEIAPEIIRLDEWGYPIVDAGAVDPDDLGTARKAVQVCPTLALRLVDVPPPS